jgi:simple sugar transport system ATP-binding protein
MTQSEKKSNGGATPPLAIELVSINKRFGDVHANKDVSLQVMAGHIHGIIGENGAGKSTLVSILYGFYSADSGSIKISGQETLVRTSAHAIANGIGMVHQHFMLVPNFTVLENVMLGHEGSLSVETATVATRSALQKLSDDFGLAVDPDMIVEDLPVGLQQRVEILKALFRGAKILILDEPTGVLTPQETEQLFDILRALRKQGVTVLLITHKLKEIMVITDDVSVMRGGEMVAHRQTAQTSPAELAELMVGRKVLLQVDHTPAKPTAPVLVITNLCLANATGAANLKDISLMLKAGEIVGVAGVSGNGQTELLDVLSGITPPTSGGFSVGPTHITPKAPTSPAKLRGLGVAHVPEDRHKRGIILPFSAAESMILGYSDTTQSNAGWWLSPSKLDKQCSKLMQDFDIRPPNPKLASANFSGGNQQKIVLAREISTQPKLLLVGQPTRGVDIGAIEFIHKQLISLRNAGCAILMVSVELDEIMSLSDRIIVMNNGQLVGELAREEATEKQLGLMMAGITIAETDTVGGPS